MENSKDFFEIVTQPVRISNVGKATYGEVDSQPGYKHSDRCVVCTAKDEHGFPIRESFDYFAKKSGYKECLIWLQDKGVKVISTKPVISHLTKHAPYIIDAKRLASQSMQKMIVTIHQEKTAASEVVQKIINIGDEKISSGEMPVTERLLIEAIKEEGRRGTKTTMDTEIETMDADFINKVKEKNNGQPA